jgi:dihydroorotase
MSSITVPGAIDLHVHFREPGDNKAEKIRTGSKAALLGGYVLVCDMPNNPGNPTWTLERLEQKKKIIEKTSYIPMGIYAGSQPESDNLEELNLMAEHAIGLKLYGAATTGNHIDYEPQQFDEIVAHWHKAAPDKPIMLHSGNDNLPEFIDLIAKKYRHHLHVCHIFSVKQALHARAAQKSGLKVSSAVCPHHMFKSSYHVKTEGWFARMQPPPLHQDEAEELFRLFSKGEIDILETDHAPHSIDSKWKAEQENNLGKHGAEHSTCYGVPGIEFALPLLFYQMSKGEISLQRIIDATSHMPAEIIGVKLAKTTQVTWEMSQYRIGHDYPKGISGSGWTPYLNNLAVGKVHRVIIAGKTLVDNGKIVVSEGQAINRSDSV